MKKTETKIETTKSNTDALQTFMSTLDEKCINITNQGLSVHRGDKELTKLALALIKDLIVNVPLATKAEDLHSIVVSIGNVNGVENSVSKASLDTIHDVLSLLTVTDRKAKKVLTGILTTLSSNLDINLKGYRTLVDSYSKVLKGDVLVHKDFEWIATLDNITPKAVDANKALLLPKCDIGGLYPTPAQLKEVESSAKTTVTFSKEIKVLTSQIGGVLKRFEGKEVNSDDFLEYLLDNVSGVVSEYIVKRDNVPTGKLKKEELVNKVDAQATEIEQLRALLAEKQAA